MKTDQAGAVSEQDDSGAEKQSFAETALRMGGKSDEEARRTGAIDKADDDVESLFRVKTSASPIHRAVWEAEVPIDLFQSSPPAAHEAAERVMNDSMDVARRHRDAGTLYNDEKKVDVPALNDLAGVGYWGMLVDKEYGGVGCPFSKFAPFLTKMATIDPTVAGLASVHGCIGAVDPVRTFGTPEQKQRFLPSLASGERLSAFALTEPGAGSDLTALSTEAVLDGDEYIVNGEKLFITNVAPGRTIGLVCLVDGKPAVLIVELPAAQDEHFQLTNYGLYAIRGAYNHGIIFKDFRVPANCLLQPKKGDGLTIAYHGLNLGRVALCANASGMIRMMMANILPWAKFRRTYGQTISTRELVQRRLGSAAGYAIANDALVQWCAGLLDAGYRGEMECVIAKIFGSEGQKHVAIEYFMKTHGGRSFLEGHVFGDNVHEFLAPCIYEGEGEMLAMGFFKSLVKAHGMEFFEPIGRALQEAGIKKPNLLNPSHIMALAGPGKAYLKWMIGQKLHSPKYTLPPMPANLRRHADYAADFLQRAPKDISGTMQKFQLALADRQCRMSELSRRVQDATTILCVALYGARSEDEIVREAADIACQELTQGLTGARPSDRYFRQVTKLGEAIADGGFASLADIETQEILIGYNKA